MADQRPAKRRRFTSDIVIVTIRVGTEEIETFKVNEKHPKKHSLFFKAALFEKWKEGKALEIDLPEDEPDIVEAYLSWLHEGTIDPPESNEEEDLTFVFLAKLYVLGEKIQDNTFCNCVIDTMTGTYDGPFWASTMMPSWLAIDILYNGTPDSCPARGFFVRLYAEYSDITKEELDKMPLEFVQDVLVAALKIVPCKKYEAQFPDRKTWHKAV